jgi:nucleotide-binding universal stress UspA family protein
MEPFKRILVDVDATASAHPALDRAVLLARSSGATVTITDVMTVPPHVRGYLPETFDEEMIEDRRRQLARVAATVTDVRAESKLLLGRPGIVLVREILRSNHDLLMRSHARDLTAPGPRPFGAVDLELLRTCPCPVLLVRHGTPAPEPRIAAAVNASTEESDEQALNAKIVELSLLMASQLNVGPPRLLQVWAPFGQRAIRTHTAAEQFAAYEEGARQRATADLAHLARSFGDRIAGLQQALRRGEPEAVIPEFVVAEGIDVVVMGTVGRAGIARLLIGNMAERILRKLPCSVLVVKPDGFVSPVRFDDA